ncbi:SAM-dependent methyltransferase [Oryzobacter telluris]|uniref:SAM-dependent methyltransferase n=1 Tax=Oryzobacter telluris TaxID=3149179 RepID=UPI00370D0E3D
MAASLSPRLKAVLDGIPLRPGLRVLELGGAPGALARELAAAVAPGGHVLVVDRSERGIALTEAACAEQVAAGLLSTRCVAAEDLRLEPDERRYDVVVANRVGALDGRHPGTGRRLMERLRDVAQPDAVLWVDGEPRDIT